MNTSLPNSPEMSAPPSSQGSFMPLVSLRKHYRIGLAVALCVAIAGTGIAWKKGKPVYSATAAIYIAPRFVNILKEPKDFDVTSYQQFRQFVEHQVHSVGRYDIVRAALAKLGERRKVWQNPGESDRDAAERLMAALKVIAIKDTYLMTVSLESKSAHDLDALVNTVVDTYIETMRQETLFYGQDARLKSLRERREEIIAVIEAKKKRRLEIAQAIGVTTFNESTQNPYDQILMDGRIALAEARRASIAAAANLDMYAGNTKSETATHGALNTAAAEIAAKDAGLYTLKSNLYGRRAKLLEQMSGLDEDHPLRKRITRELADIDQEIERVATGLIQQTSQGLVEQRRAELRKAQQVERQLDQQMETQREKAAWFANLYNEALNLNEELSRVRKQLDEIDNRLDFFQMESQAPGYMRVDSYARPPEFPTGGGRKKLLVLALLAALGLGTAVPIGIDLLDRRLRTAAQVAKLLGHPPFAVLFEPSDQPAIRRALSDQMRRLAVAIERDHRRQGTRVVLFTSAKPAAGVTGVALELALELNRLGNRVLVIEANPLKPDVRYRASSEVGLLELLDEPVRLDQAIIPSSQNLPDRIGIGLPTQPHLHGYRHFQGLLEGLRKSYDLIFLDAPPVLLSGDTEYLSTLADVTLMLVGAGQVLPGELRRAAGILQKLDPAAVGFIVTHLEIYQGGGYYAKLLEDYAAADREARKVLDSHPLARS